MPDIFRKYTFSLSTLLLVTALVAVCLGIMKVAPVASLAISAVSLVALERTARIVRNRPVESGPASAYEKLGVFGLSFAIISLEVGVLVCTFFAVLVTSLGIGAAYDKMQGGVPVSGVRTGVAIGTVLGAVAIKVVGGRIQARFRIHGN